MYLHSAVHNTIAAVWRIESAHIVAAVARRVRDIGVAEELAQDALVAKAVAAGATTPNAPVDHGFMFQHGFADLDGHQWEVFWMDEAAAPAQM